MTEIINLNEIIVRIYLKLILKTNLKSLSSSTFKNILMQTSFHKIILQKQCCQHSNIFRLIAVSTPANTVKRIHYQFLPISPPHELHSIWQVLFLQSQKQLHNPRHGIMAWIMTQKSINGLVLRNIIHGFLLQTYNSRFSKKWIPFIIIKLSQEVITGRTKSFSFVKKES